MSGIFNFIGKLLSGILGFIGGLFGGKKNGSGYYLELDDAKSVGAAAKSSSEQANGSAAKTVAKSAKTDGQVAKAVANEVVTKEAAQPIVSETAKVTKIQAAPAKLVASTNNSLNLPEPQIRNFATDYLIPTASSSRRRPGANMRSFLDMAKQVKTPIV